MADLNQKLLIANGVGLAINAMLAAVLAVGLLGEAPADAPAVAPARTGPAVGGGGPAAPPAPGPGPAAPSDGPERTARFLDDTISPVEKAATDMGADLASLLPSDADVARAKASGSLASAESQAVIATLKAAYARFNMPFPELPGAGAAPGGGGGPLPDAPRATTTDGGAQDILRAYFTVTISQLRAQAEAKGVDVSGTLPADAAVQAAIASGDIGSAASAAVLADLRAAHARAGLSFREPAVP